MTKADNVVLSGNTLRVGRDDGGVGVWSPDYGIVIKNCNHCIVRDNVWNRGVLKEGIVLLGDNPDVSSEGNVGTAFTPED